MNKTNWYMFVIVFLAGALITGFIFNSCNKPEPVETVRYERDPNDMNKVDSLEKAMNLKDHQLDSMNNKIDSLNNKLAEIGERRKINKINYRKELKEIESTNPDTLVGYIRRQLGTE